MRGHKAKIALWSNVQKQPELDSSSTPSAKKPYVDYRFDIHQDGRKSFCHISGRSADSKKKGAQGGQHS